MFYVTKYFLNLQYSYLVQNISQLGYSLFGFIYSLDIYIYILIKDNYFLLSNMYYICV